MAGIGWGVAVGTVSKNVSKGVGIVLGRVVVV